MEEKEFRNESQSLFKPNKVSLERRYMHRRKALCNGFTYVSMVGWICRREKARRESEEKGR